MTHQRVDLRDAILNILARDLLQAHWGVMIESFKTGNMVSFSRL